MEFKDFALPLFLLITFFHFIVAWLEVFSKRVLVIHQQWFAYLMSTGYWLIALVPRSPEVSSGIPDRHSAWMSISMNMESKRMAADSGSLPSFLSIHC